MNKDKLRLSNRLLAAQAEMERHGVDTIFTRDLATGEEPDDRDVHLGPYQKHELSGEGSVAAHLADAGAV